MSCIKASIASRTGLEIIDASSRMKTSMDRRECAYSLCSLYNAAYHPWKQIL